jgi:DUF4097 and DUF4098 domain-containing protein YvlB
VRAAWRTIAVLTALLVMTTATATEVTEQRPLAADGQITVRVDRGEVAVRGWDRHAVEVRGELGRDTTALRWSGDRQSVELGLVTAESGRAELEIMVPRGCRLDVRTLTADVWVDAMVGDVAVRSVSGDVDIAGSPRSVRVELVSGDLDLDVACDEMTVVCENGDVTVSGVRRALSVDVLRGDVEVVTGRELATLSCQVLSGDVAFEGAVPAVARWTVNTERGDVSFDLGDPADATFTLTTLVGDIETELATVGESDARELPGPMATRTVRAGRGRGEVQVMVLSGDIDVGR